MKLDLGCGKNKKEGYTGIDLFDWSLKYPKGEFICGRVPKILERFKDNSVEEIYTSHFIEHIEQDKIIETFNEVYRILAIGGLFDIYVPQTPGRGAFCDPTHKSYYNDLSWRYYDMNWCRELSESYGIKCDFQIIENRVLTEFNLHAVLKKRG